MSFLISALLIISFTNQLSTSPVQVDLSPSECSIQVVEYVNGWADNQDLLIINKQYLWIDKMEDSSSLETTATFAGTWLVDKNTKDVIRNLSLSVENVHANFQLPLWNEFYTLDLTGTYPSKRLYAKAYGNIEIWKGKYLQARTSQKTIYIFWNIVQ